MQKLFYLENLSIVIMMLISIYTHLYPDVIASILPIEFKPPVMPISYIVLVLINIYLYKKTVQ